MYPSENDPILDENDLSAAPVEKTSATPHPRLFRKTVKSVLIIVLSVLCVIAGVLIHRLHTTNKVGYPSFPSADLDGILGGGVYTSPVVGQNKSLVSAAVPKSVVVQTSSVSAEQPDITDDADAVQVKSEALADQIQEAFNAVKPAEPVIEEASSAPTVHMEPKAVAAGTMSTGVYPKSTLMLRDILALQDAFLHTDSCVDAYETVSQKAPMDDLSVQRVLINLTPFCARAGNSIEMLQKRFLTDKRSAKYAYYRLSSTPVMAYIKSFLSALVDIHRVNPTGQDAKDMMDKAQTALKKGHVAAAMMAIDKLPVSIKSSFAGFLQEAYAYRRAKESLTHLILTFEQGE